MQPKLGNQGELKGKALDEQECAAFIKLLSRFDVIVEVVCMDMGMTTDEQIARHKSKWPSKKPDDNTPYDPCKIAGLSNQLYAQMQSMFTLIQKIIKIAINYYAQRMPRELSNFEWFIDSKGVGITTYEDIFAWIIKPMLQAIQK